MAISVSAPAFVHGGEQALAADLFRDVVVFLFEAERSGHAAAARIDFGNLQARNKPQRLQAGSRADVGFLVTMAV